MSSSPLEEVSKVMIFLLFGIFIDGGLIVYYFLMVGLNINFTKLDRLKENDFKIKFWIGFGILNAIVIGILAVL